MEQRMWTRNKAVFLSAAGAFILGIPSLLTFGTVKIAFFQSFNFFNIIDLLSTGYMMPLCAVLTCIFVGIYWNKLDTKKTNPLIKFMRYCILYISPFFISQFILFPFLRKFQALESGLASIENIIVQVNIGLTVILLVVIIYIVIFKIKTLTGREDDRISK
jgi:SNF family Na+-dependent transporter